MTSTAPHMPPKRPAPQTLRDVSPFLAQPLQSCRRQSSAKGVILSSARLGRHHASMRWGKRNEGSAFAHSTLGFGAPFMRRLLPHEWDLTSLTRATSPP